MAKRVLLLGALGLWGCLASPASAQDFADSFLIYPDADSSANPRVACIAPVPREEGGHYMDVSAIFRYSFAPFVDFPEGGSLRADVRDNPQRKAYEILSLIAGDRQLTLRIGRAGEGKKPELVYAINGREASKVTLPAPLASGWNKLQLRWNASSAELTAPDGQAVTLPLPQPFRPEAFSVLTSAVDQLQIDGRGSLLLDWENSYAARIAPRPGETGLKVEPLGFDAYFVSQDPAARDCPYVHLLNASDQERRIKLDFAMQGEVSAASQKWSQDFLVPARSGLTQPIEFPQALKSDVYHLQITSTSGDFSETVTKHFAFAGNGPGGKPFPKFGLHDSDRMTFGFWPDTLPITLAHQYLRWAYVYGPAWESDVDTTAQTAEAELNWNPRIDWVIRQGLTPYVSLLSSPDTEWMRQREFEAARMKIFPWGKIGGYPNLDRYREFLQMVAARYKGRVPMYEVENEPNAWMGGMSPEDYAGIAKTAASALHAVDPAARVFGICGTGSFVPWMRNVFSLGGAADLNGVSIHTYVTPRTPEAAQLPEKLAEVNDVIKQSGLPLALLNSETGSFVALREDVDRPISNTRLQELIQQGVEPFFQAKGWPNYAVDERAGAISITRNALFNFLAGAEYFTFFGWNDRWPKPDWWGKPGEACFAMISSSRQGERTPSLYTLAVGVLAEQLRAAIPSQGVAVHKGGVSGGKFPTTDGGEIAMLWSAQGKRSVLIEWPDAERQGVSLFGQELVLPTTGKGSASRLEIGEEPVYLYSRKPGIQVLPSPVINITSDVSGGFRFTIVNHQEEDWKGSVTFSSDLGWKVIPSSINFTLAKGQRRSFTGRCEFPAGTPKGTYPVNASLTLPDGSPFFFPASVRVRPTLVIPRVAEGFAWQDPAQWKDKPVRSIDQADQVVVGQPPLLASLQEEKFWKGSAELSAQCRFASDGASLFLYLEVTDANFRIPQKWPGVLGSCVELFLDQRPAPAFGQAAYGPGVTQVLIRPASGTEPLAVFQATEKHGVLAGLQVTGGEGKAGKYWIAAALPLTLPNVPFGLDIGINGPPKEGPGRKSQMILFGSADDSIDASGFGTATLEAQP